MKSDRITTLLAGVGLMLLMPDAMAAERLAWKTYLFSAMGIAMVVACIFAFRNPKAESTSAKLLLAGAYFWVVTFAELMVLAVVYYFNK